MCRGSSYCFVYKPDNKIKTIKKIFDKTGFNQLMLLFISISRYQFNKPCSKIQHIGMLYPLNTETSQSEKPVFLKNQIIPANIRQTTNAMPKDAPKSNPLSSKVQKRKPNR